MPFLVQIRHTLQSLFQRRQLEADLEREFRAHWEQEVENNLHVVRIHPMQALRHD